MCGLCGYWDPAAATAADALEAGVLAMAARIRHRGPDGAGAWVDPAAGLAIGHRRLSIIDLSHEGHQPMVSASGRWIIAYNGEVYNFPEVRAAVEAAVPGVRWRGHSDTEIMLAAIERWGVTEAVRRFNGMFAFALWDRETRMLWLGRDRAGEKPLYYGWSGGTFFFGSELKAFASHPAWRPSIDRGAVSLFMRHNYIPAPYTIYEGIAKLPPGTLLSLPAASARPGAMPAPVPYWEFAAAVRDGTAQPLALGDGDAIEALDALLRDAVAQRMVADVPLGAFLSGGIDSSTVVALMQAQSARPVRTFSIGFHEAGYNEAEHAKAVASHLGTDHTELYVSPDEARGVIPLLPAMFDEPFADSSQIPTHLVSAMARRHVTVALSGDAGDELFGGYQRYFIGRDVWQRMTRVPAPVRRTVARVLTGVSPDGWQRMSAAMRPVLPGRLRRPDFGRLVHRVGSVLGTATPEAFYLGLVSHEADPAGLTGAAEPPTWLTDRARWPATPSFTERMMFLDAVSYLPDDILVKVDRAAMAVSLEGRIPFLDHRVIEFAWRLPLSQKVRGAEGKWILRRVLDRYVPRSLIDRPKMGFGVPIDEWLRGPLKAWGEDLLGDAALRAHGLLDPARVRAAWTAHQTRRENRQYWLWNALMLQAWLAEERRGA